VTSLLASCDQRTRTGRRDLAILTLLVRLGLRAGEVAALTLDDIDWRCGEITVRGKGNRHDRLPLPVDVGERIVAYLHNGRPEAAQDRAVFVRAQAPFRALTSNAVTTVVVNAGRRVGRPTSRHVRSCRGPLEKDLPSRHLANGLPVPATTLGCAPSATGVASAMFSPSPATTEC